MKQYKPTIIEQTHHINPPRTFTPMRPETSHMSSEDEEMRPLNDIASSSTQAPVMLVRGVPNATQGKV